MRDPSTIPNRVHIVGAGGTGMSGLAKILSQLGHSVSGSDLKPGRMLDVLRDVGVETWLGHDPASMAEVGVVVRSSAVPATDPEVEAARALGIEVWDRPQLLSRLTAENPAMGVAGTHGKTTSTAMMVSALRGMGHDPSFLVGGEIVGLNTGAHAGDETFVLEADEAFGTFRHLDLASVLVTNIEADHLDYYGTITALEDAFGQVVDRVTGPRVGCIDDAGVRRLAQRVELTGYGVSEDAEFRIEDLDHAGGGVSFTLSGPGEPVRVALAKPGMHVASNAAGVVTMLTMLGYDQDAVATALRGFSGVRRRYEVRGIVRGVTVVDDYAHHPTEVGATIEAAARATTGKVIVVFQPHRYTRTADLGPAFGVPLARADHVVVTDIYSAGEQPIIGVSGRVVVQATEAAGGTASFVRVLADVPEYIASIATEGDTVLLLGAGDITTIAAEVTKAIGASP